MNGTWPGAELSAAIAGADAAGARRRTFLALSVAGAGWAVAGPGDAALGVGVALIAVVGAAVESGLIALRHDAADRAADDLIEQGFPFAGRADAVSLRVQHRAAQLSSPRRRRQLAGSLRWYLQLECEEAAARGAHRRPVPPARGFLAHRQLVEQVADMLEHPRADARAAALVTRMLTAPPGVAIRTGNGPERIEFEPFLAQIHTVLSDSVAPAYGCCRPWRCDQPCSTVNRDDSAIA
jgi:hypothetical protein